MHGSGAVLVLLVAVLFTPLGSAQEPPKALPPNLVLDLRLFEARLANPDLAAMDSLSFFIATDGRKVSANQWLSTVGSKVPEAFLAALASESLAVQERLARAQWQNGARSFDTEIELERFEPGGAGKGQVVVRLARGGKMLREVRQAVELQDGRTTVWSSRDLQIHPSEYISHFREFENQERRGELYTQLSRYSIFLVMTLTPRLLTEAEAALPPAVELPPPPDAKLPDLESPLGIPLQGTVVVGFDVDSGGSPVSPQILRSTVPEANPRVVAEASRWSFPEVAAGRRARVTLKVSIP